MTTTGTQPHTDTTAFAEDWRDWHRHHETVRADRHGFLAITGRYWLTAEPQRFPDAPGAWSTDDDRGVVVRLDHGEELVVDGIPVRGEHVFGVLPERGGVSPAFDDAVVEVARRGGHDVVRPRHPGAPVRTAYAGTPAFPPDPRWVVRGRYTAFPEPRPTTVGA